MSDVRTEEKLLDHAYDGIQEYDNPTPGWWVWIFVLSIVFSVFYAVYYHVSTESVSVQQDFDNAMSADLLKQFGKMGTLKQDQASILGYMANDSYVKFGQGVFKSNCVSCHGSEGAGLVGPNMTDDFYKNIKVLGDIPQVINNGAANGA